MEGIAQPTFRRFASVHHAEAVAVAPDGAIWASTESGRLLRISAESAPTEVVAEIGAYLLGLCFDRAGRVYCCAYDQGAIIRFDPHTGATETYSETPLRNPNWAVFGSAGDLFVSDSGSEDLADCDGRILRIPVGGGPGEILPLRPLHYPNGLALAPDDTLYIAESFASLICCYRQGRLEAYARVDRTIPDGLALDVDGGLIVACFQPNRILRIPPGGGDPETVLEDWTGQELLTPTNVAFFGAGNAEIVVASLCGWALSAASVPWQGLPLNYPIIP